MKIVIENKIPYIKGMLEPFAQVDYRPNADITPEAVRDADALLVRTRTRCDARLLNDSRVQFIGSATIGTDHIDLNYCQAHGIAVHNAPGCNAPAVAQWVMSSIAQYLMANNTGFDCHAFTLGIVGVGHVGSIVERWARRLGFNVLLCDPPRAEVEGDKDFVDIDRLARDSHFITFHTPLTTVGKHPTMHLCDAALLAKASQCRLILNAARGGVCRDDDLAAWHGACAIDCWENEPAPLSSLLRKALVATPHIAGYSAEGKQRGTAMVVEALNRHFGFNAHIDMPQAPRKGADNVTWEKIVDSYNPLLDTATLRDDPTQFEQLRNNYHLRHEVQ